MTISLEPVHTSGTDEPAPAVDDGNKYTKKRIEQAKKVGQALTSISAQIEAYEQGLQDGFIDEDPAKQGRVKAQKEDLERTINRVKSIRNKPVPEQPAHVDRLRISDVNNKTSTNPFKNNPYTDAKVDISAVRHRMMRAYEDNPRAVTYNIGFHGHQQGHEQDPEKTLERVDSALEKEEWVADSPTYTDEDAAKAIGRAHSLTAYELIETTARDKFNTRIYNNVPESPMNKVKRWMFNIDNQSPAEILTYKPSTQRKIRRGEQGRPVEFDGTDHDYTDARENHFKHTILSLHERQAYQAQGQWLPRTARPPRSDASNPASYKLKQRFEQYQDNHVPGSYLTEATVTMDNALTEAERDMFKEQYRDENNP